MRHYVGTNVISERENKRNQEKVAEEITDACIIILSLTFMYRRRKAVLKMDIRFIPLTSRRI